jgi:hypothetical protein
MITDEQIKARAKAIGDRPAFPVQYHNLNIGMTYRMYLASKCWTGGEFHGNAIKEVQWLLEQLAKAELEAEQEVGNV